nr:glycosyltransferase [Companilactobacillus zhachilii]
MATYNGEKYIEEQLDSIRKQNCKVDEVLIRDDISTDKTAEIIEKYIKKYNLNNWSFFINRMNLGWRQNFTQLLNETTGDIIFLSDQDDVWDFNKVSNMMNIFENSNKVEVLVSDYEQKIIGNALPANMDKLEELNIKNNLFLINSDIKNYFIGRPGWTFAIRKNIIPEYDDIRTKATTKSHDSLIWQISLSRGTLYHLRQITGTWTLHEDSAMAVEKKKIMTSKNLAAYFRDEVIILECLLKGTNKNKPLYASLKKLKIIDESRLDVLKSKSLAVLIKRMIHYPSVKSVIGDLIRIYD